MVPLRVPACVHCAALKRLRPGLPKRLPELIILIRRIRAMANREGSAAAGRADRSLALQSEGAGGVGKDPLQGREGSKTGQGVTPSLPATGFTPVGMGRSACPHFPVDPWDARGTKRCLG